MDLSEIFKAYDIRGIYPDQLNEELAEKVGKAFALFNDENEVIVGWDMRLSSLALVNAFCRGVVAVGKNVIKIGQVSTDGVYFAAGKMNLPGVMFTASHNPKEWNGMKFCKAGAVPISKDIGLEDIKQLVEKNEFEQADQQGEIKQNITVLDQYVEFCLSFIKPKNLEPLKIVVDAGNGMAGKIIPLIYKHTNCEIIPLYFDLNGTFPNHQASPIELENVKDLMEKVKLENADFGMAFDGDADRVFFIDNLGNRVSSSSIVALIAKNLLQKNPQEKIIYNIVCSKIVPETVKENGGESIIERVGHSFIKQKMKETNAIFAGEHSGHYYYRDNFRADSGMITALIMTEIISNYQGPFSELLKQFSKYHAIEETNFEVIDKEKTIKRLAEIYKENKKYDFDGMTFEFKDWWFNVRPSNTEPKLRLNLEADTKELMEEKFKDISSLIKRES